MAAKTRLLCGASSEALNRFVFFVALPVRLFHAVAQVEPVEIFNWHFIGGFVGSALVMMLAAMAVSSAIFRKGVGDSALFGMSSAFANTVYMGIPLVMIAFGEATSLPAVIASVFQGVVLTILAVVALEMDHKDVSGRTMLLTFGGSLLRNPILIAPVAGITWSFSGFRCLILLARSVRFWPPQRGSAPYFRSGCFSLKSLCTRAPGKYASC